MLRSGSKSKKNKRKKAAEKAKTNGDVVNSNGVQGEAEPEIQETETASPTVLLNPRYLSVQFR